MDDFDARLGPDSNRRASNVARGPYVAAKYFFYIIDTILHTVFGIKKTTDQVHSRTIHAAR